MQDSHGLLGGTLAHHTWWYIHMPANVKMWVRFDLAPLSG